MKMRAAASCTPLARGCRARRWSAAAARDSLGFDVLVVGAGPAGMSAAIRLKQTRPDLSVCLIEKGSAIGAHTLSGNVFDPRALDELIPDWRSLPNVPLETPVTNDQLWYLPSATSKLNLPVLPPALRNHGNYVISLGRLVRWLGEYAEQVGVEVYPGFAASDVLYNDSDAIVGIATKDVGIGRNGERKSSFQPGMELRASQTIFAEGACGSLSEQVIEKFNLRSTCDPQTYSIGLKELWRVNSDHHDEGAVTHTVGWPLPNHMYGGSFLYHMKPDLVAVGLVVGLDYPNPYTDPYQLFQKFKHHPAVSRVLGGGTPLEYGARAISSGGFQAIPKLSVPGGILVGCAAGFLNVPRIKGTHTAMKSGMLAADSIVNALQSAQSIAQVNLDGYGDLVERSWIWSELKQVRNVKPSFKKFGGLFGGMLYSGLDLMLLHGRAPWTFHSRTNDADSTHLADDFAPSQDSFKPDNEISFDLLTNLERSGVRHDEDQPVHLQLRGGVANDFPVETSLRQYAGPEQYFCPAKVYEYVTDDKGKDRLQINASNCIHCKTCDVKTPGRFIRWTTPEGGGGPSFSNM